MNSEPKFAALALTTVLGLATNVFAQDSGLTLTIGDKAPSIDIEHWIQGKPFTEFEEGKVYVVEFWATWCGPCIASMPHMSALHEEYQDEVGFVGVSDEPLPTVTGWLERKGRDGKVNGERASYPLTTDPDESVKNDYFRAAGQRGIPSAFLVGKTCEIEWIGHPMTIDAPLAAVTAGEWDRDSFKLTFEAEIADERVMSALMAKVRPMIQEGAVENAIATLEGARDDLLQPANLDYQVFALRTQRGLWNDEAIETTAATATTADNPMLLNAMAWSLATATATPAEFQSALLDVALAAATRAVEMTDSKDGSIVDTLARVHYEMGDPSTALEWQEKAVALAPNEASLVEALEKYKAEAEAKE